MEDIVRIPLGYIIDIDADVFNGEGCWYFANMTETDIMEMYMSFIEEDWEECVQISQGYEYIDLPSEDWWYGMSHWDILHQIANRYAVNFVENVPFYNP